MYYRCTKCNAAVQVKGTPSVKCKCSRAAKWVRAERNWIIKEQDEFHDRQIFRSGEGDWTLENGVFKRLEE